MLKRAQGATEYLVLLAVVLIVALVSVALLGFFPGMASDAQITQSQIYWRGAQPIAISDVGWVWKQNDLCWSALECGGAYLRIRNTGMYPIRLSKLLVANTSLLRYYDQRNGSTSGFGNITLGPGEETCLGNHNYGSGTNDTRCNYHSVYFTFFPYASGYSIDGAKSLCNTDGTGTMVLPGFGFEYVEYIEGQQITKKFIGSKDLILKCTG